MAWLPRCSCCWWRVNVWWIPQCQPCRTITHSSFATNSPQYITRAFPHAFAVSSMLLCQFPTVTFSENTKIYRHREAYGQVINLPRGSTSPPSLNLSLPHFSSSDNQTAAMKVLKMLTYGALVTLLMLLGAANLPSIAKDIPQDLIKVFALFPTLLLALRFLVPAVILRERTAMIMGHARRHDLSRMLRTLSELAMLPAAVAMHRLLPYFTGISRGDGDGRLLATFIALTLGLYIFFVILRERMAMCMRLAFRHGQSFGLQILSKLAMAVAVYRLLPYLTGTSWADGDDRLLPTLIALALASCWLLTRSHVRAWRTNGIVMAAAHGEIHRRRNPALDKLATTALALMVFSASYILPILTEKTSEDGHGIFSMCRLFALFAKFALASGFLVATVLFDDVPGSVVATHAAVMAVTMMMLIDMFMLGMRVVAAA